MHGRGEIIRKADPAVGGIRGVVRIRVERVSDSCGYELPLMEYDGERPQPDRWLQQKGPQGVRDCVRKRNVASIDGFPAFD